LTSRRVSPKVLQARRDCLITSDGPRFVRCYDNGGRTCDRYTVVFYGRYRHTKTGGEFVYLTMDDRPFHPQGFGQHGSSRELIDVVNSGRAPGPGKECHLGKRVKFKDLPADCRKLALSDYCVIWDLDLPEPPKHVADREEWETNFQAEMQTYANEKSSRTI